MKRVMLILAACLFILLLIFITVPVLLVTAEEEVERIAFVQKEHSFSVRWIHSVEKEEWEEMFVVKNGQIVLDSTRFKTFGAGVPSATGEDTFIEDGWVYMTKIHQPIGKELVIRTGKTTDHRLIQGGQILKLKPSQSYRLTVEEINLWNAIGYFIATRMR